MQTADDLMALGFTPVIPHLAAFWAMSTEAGASRSESEWIQHGLRLLERCDTVLRLPGKSSGSDIETDYADAHGIPVYLTVGAMGREHPHD